ncbi:MAG TPA: cell division protein FtsQ, partial [Lachnospiraceae bacterium]|nr:cell division protein FtsQ [Lachnospiraceae bacterium]
MKKRIWILLGGGIAAALLGGLIFVVLRYYKVTTVYVEGNIHYSNEEIMDMVMTGTLGDNSLYLALKYKNKGVDNVPFVQTMDVKILSPDTIKITVYQKA